MTAGVTRSRLSRAWLVVLVFMATGGSPAAAEPFEVSYRSAETLYIAAGSKDGLVSGGRLEIVRDGTVIAEVEILVAAESSAACRLLVEHAPVAVGDLARQPLPEPAPQMTPEAPLQPDTPAKSHSEAQRPSTPSSAPPAATPTDPGIPATETAPGPAEEESRTAAVEADGPPAPIEASEARIPPPASGPTQPVELALEAQPVVPLRWQARRRGARAARTRLRGTLGLDWESSSEGRGEERLDYGRLNSRLDLRLRDIGGLPYELRVRLRTQQNRRGRGDELRLENRDRFYELSLTYDPPQGRYAYRVGRMSASPFVGIGYFDGVLGQFALSSIFEIGAFAGSSADIEQSGFTTSRQKYGAFGRFTAPTTDSGYPWEVVVAGIREYGEQDISREYVTLESRYSSGGRWSFFQRAEVDFNRGWRKELSGTASQLSNFSLSTTARLSKYGRLSLAYDRFEQYRTEETRELPEDLFQNLQRQGIRANLQFGNPRKLNFAATASLRNQAGDAAQTLSYGFWARHGQVTPLKLSMGLNYLAFSNEFTQGYLLSLRTSKRVKWGHQFDLTLGTRLSGSELFADEADERTSWARFRVWFELPRSLYSTAEIELTEGETLDGRRFSAGLGYRF